MLEFAFMRKALLAGLLLSIMIPMIGVVMVNRKTSMIGDALSHTALAGVGMGLILGFDPLIGSAIICVIAAFLIELIRKRFPQYGDMATAVIMSTGLGIAAILSDFAPGGNSFESYLFGSISSVTNMDVINISLVFVAILCASIAGYSGLLAISIDPNLARLSGVKVKAMNAVFTFLSAITIALAVKIVGALMVTSLIVLPVATSLIVARSYKSAYLLTIGLGIVYMMVGIILSFYLDIKPGGAIVVNAVLGMLVFVLYRKVRKA
ncbi:High-affinity zinc uptake system membrane protein znuB [Urinicoccus massiliensis]|uniref:High-affinity zinc uptake system membrane protein znuB n=1 Tax=Urinicoccus massiliensis TaxID=1723382 RepID=A0A8H2QXH0_9FIRM|nr:metal ABC transporter permease [Urinicoccus massiliensis]KGF10732.1 zinc ABC transporter permease [Tissierellia bacterium S5-A11]VFB15794.1 High-affinity zinc uptake system membrane protein znuB [Urinicoccus massiliensis]